MQWIWHRFVALNLEDLEKWKEKGENAVVVLNLDGCHSGVLEWILCAVVVS